MEIPVEKVSFEITDIFHKEQRKSPIVVNLFGPPGAGKSTGAAQVFADLKKAGINAELITEYPKDKTWEKNLAALSCQEYIFGKQSFRMSRCRDQVEVLVTDSPLPLSLIYNKNPALDYSFQNVVLNVFNTYENMNYYINRVKPYNPKGRNQTEAESDALNEPIKTLLSDCCISYKTVDGDNAGYKLIVQEVVKAIEEDYEI